MEAMPTYVQIGDDVTPSNVETVIAAAQVGTVYVVHSICATLEGRRRMQASLKRAGCDPDVVRVLGWATVAPDIPRPAPAPVTPAEAETTKPEPVKRPAMRGKQRKPTSADPAP